MTDTQSLHSLPLFPLNTVLFPEGLLSLQVFEVRYLDMIRKCQHADAPFGVVALQAGQEVRKAGAQTLAQDEKSCVVYGMPQAVAKAGIASESLPLDRVAQRILVELGR